MNIRFLNININVFFKFLLLNIVFLYGLQAQQFKTHYFDGLISFETSKDSISFLLKQYKEQAIVKKDTTFLINSLISLSAFERYSLNYNEAFSNAGEALFIAEEFNDDYLKARAYEELGVLTYLFKQNKESGSNFITAHKLFCQLYDKGKLDFKEFFQSHYNLVMHYQRVADSKKLEKYIDICNTLIKQYEINPIYDVYLDEKEASLKEWNEEFNEALDLLKLSANKLERLVISSEIEIKQQQFLLIIYGRIATIYMKLQNLDLASLYFKKFVKIEGNQGETMFYRSFLYSRYAEVLNQQGLYAEAYSYEQKSNTIGNAYLNPRNERNKGFLTIKNRYKDALLNKREQLNRKNLELAKGQEEILRFRILLIVIALILVVVGFVVRSRIRSLKFQRKEEGSKELLTIKNRELTSNTLQLIEKEQVIKKLSEFIKESNLDKRSQSLLRSIERSSTSLWDAFNKRFTEQNIGFYERLQKKVPNLSSSDLKLCALIKLNFSGKEMAYLLGISLGSVHVARHRLRRKIKLERHQNLTSFINSI